MYIYLKCLDVVLNTSFSRSIKRRDAFTLTKFRTITYPSCPSFDAITIMAHCFLPPAMFPLDIV